MKSFKILIAEDEALEAMGLETMLAHLGHEVVGKAKTGSEAVAMAAKTNPDLAIMDIKMLGMDGLAAAKAILTKTPMPIIILSAFSEEDLVKEANEIGVASYLTKPVMEATLRPAIALAASRFSELQRLRKEVDTLQEALETRKLVERAKGIIMKRQGLSEEEAFKLLQKQSSCRNVKMAQLAGMIVETSDFL